MNGFSAIKVRGAVVYLTNARGAHAARESVAHEPTVVVVKLLEVSIRLLFQVVRHVLMVVFSLDRFVPPLGLAAELLVEDATFVVHRSRRLLWQLRRLQLLVFVVVRGAAFGRFLRRQVD